VASQSAVSKVVLSHKREFIRDDWSANNIICVDGQGKFSQRTVIDGHVLFDATADNSCYQERCYCGEREVASCLQPER
jgi:hypothetical protein